MQIASLGSGSRGNSTVVEDGETTVLVDLGFSAKQASLRLSRLGRQPEDINAILVTHEHADHIHGVATFARKYNTPVYLTHGTRNNSKLGLLPECHEINCHRAFQIGSLNIEPVPVPHDAREPCQYVISSNGYRAGILTDLGHITPHVRTSYRDCDLLLLECNHDLEMLMNGPYAWPLKQRVSGDRGHLNNGQSAELLESLNLTQLRHLVISHISEKNNNPDIALASVTAALATWPGQIHVASQEQGLDWISLDR